MFKYGTTERHLISTLLKYERKNVKPILDYAIEKLGPTGIDSYMNKRKALFEMFPNIHHSLKLSAIGLDHERFLELMNTARNNNCKVLVDAEESDIQGKIDAQCNSAIANGYPQVYKTYQMYNKDALEKLMDDIEAFQHCNLTHNIKLVTHREVVYDNKEKTNESYDNAVKMLLKLAKDNDNINVIFATHNKQSINLIKDTFEPNVHHAFLMGMEPPEILYTRINKLVHVPFGPLHMTTPYIARHFVENNRYLDAFLTYQRCSHYSQYN